MFTRQDYQDGNCTHRAYYGQFATPRHKAILLDAFGLMRLQRAVEADNSLRDIPLSKWDALADKLNPPPLEAGEASKNWTKAQAVCVLKETAKQLVEERT